MKKQQYEFSAEKNEQLIKPDILPHPNPIKYPKQKMYVININDYVYAVPFVKKDENTVFLKTIFPDRKLTKHYLKV